jgi:hypothetical protein
MPADLIDEGRIRPFQVARKGPSAQNPQNFRVPTLSRRSALKPAESPHGLPQMCWPGRGADRAPANALSTADPGVSANSTGAVLRSSRYCPS